MHTEAAGSAIPDAFGPFRVLHQIGAGTLGPVYRAYDAERERLVAVKLFRLDLPPERVHQLVAAFDRLIGSELTHPAIATPLATGIVGAAAYLAIDYIAAESLDLAVREYGPAPPADALRVAAQLAGALDFAAAVNIVHGAIHPRDVLLSSDDTRLTGIGIVRALQDVGVNAPIRRPYTAPERAAGQAWDRRADVFTLAALAHELLWGRRIVGAGHAIDGLPALPGADQLALSEVFARAFAENPDERFDTALQFAEALKGAFPDVATAPVMVRPISERESSVPSSVEGAVLSEAAAPALNNAERPVQSEVEGLALSDVEGPLEHVAPAREPVSVAAAVPVSAELPELNLRAEPRQSVFRDPERVALPAIPSREPARLRPPMIFGAIAAALAIGIAVGYGVGMRRQPNGVTETPPAQVSSSVGSMGSTAPSAAATTAAREATDVPVAEPGRPAPAPAPAAPVNAPPAAKQTDTSPAPRTSSPGRASNVESAGTGRTPSSRAADRRTSASRSTPPPVTDRTNDRVAARSRAAASATAGRFVGQLSVDSRPEGARVFLDGRPVGATPLQLPTVNAGEHAIRLERDGYRRWSSSIRIVASEKTRVTASLER